MSTMPGPFVPSQSLFRTDSFIKRWFSSVGLSPGTLVPVWSNIVLSDNAALQRSTGFYLKIGRLVIFSYRTFYSAQGGSAGTIDIDDTIYMEFPDDTINQQAILWPREDGLFTNQSISATRSMHTGYIDSVNRRFYPFTGTQSISDTILTLAGFGWYRL